MDASPLPSKDKVLLWQSGEKKIIRSVGPHSLHTDLSWSPVVATTVLVVAVRILLIVVNNLTKEGEKFVLQWSCHSSDFRRTAILTATFYDPVCVPLRAIHIETSETLVHSKTTTLHTRNHVSYQLTHSKIFFGVNNTVNIIKVYVFNRKTGSRIRNF
jgi:hypothetical protein